MLNWSRFGSRGWLSWGTVFGVAIATPAIVSPASPPAAIAAPADPGHLQAEAITAPKRLAPARFSPARFSPARFSPARLAPARLAPARLAPARLAPDWPAPPERLVSAGLAPVRLAQAPPLFEDLFIGLNAPDHQARGLSGGPLPAMRQAGVETTSTGRCVGFVDRDPDHRLTLSGFMDYLRLEVQSNADTSIVVRGPGGSWCNDNYRDRNPGMAGQWLPGTYEIWVGSPTNRDYYPYVLRVTQRPEDPATLPVPAGVP